MALDNQLIKDVSKSGLTDDALFSMMQNDLEVTKENNRSAEAIKAQEMQDKKEIRYHWLCLITRVRYKQNVKTE